MSATATLPREHDAARDRRPGLPTLARVELRKSYDTRAGFWLLLSCVLLALAVAAISIFAGHDSDHTLNNVFNNSSQTINVLLPVVGILLVTSEWSQRTGMITFALVPVRSRVLVAKLLAALVLAVALLAVSVAIVAAGVLVGGSGWAGAGTLVAQSVVYLTAGMVTGVAFGMVLLASAPAIVALFALPIAWTAIASLSFLKDAAPWLDTRLALDPLCREVLSATQWAHVATALALWMALPLALGVWRITRREVAA